MASNRSRPGGARGPPPSLGRAMPAPLPSSSSSSSSSFPGSSSSAPGSSASSFPGSSSAGAGTTSSSNSNASPRFPRIRARYAQLKGTRAFRTIAFVNAHRRGFFGGAVLLYLGSSYLSAAVHARKRDRIHPSSYLYWKIYDGGIVEAKSSANVLSNLLFTSGGGGSDEPARIMTIFDVVKTLSWAARDDRIKGIIADFSSLSSPAVQSPYSLGLAQIEEICDAVEELNTFKNERLGAENWRSIAFTDTFDSQGQYALASSFQEIYVQPTGEVPLTGLGSQLPFFKRLIDWLGITVQAEAREEYKSFIAQYTSEKLSAPQTENQLEIMNSLNDLMLGRIARNRYSVGPATLPLDSDASSSAQGLAAESVETASNQPLTLASPLETSEVPTSSRVSPEGDETKEIGAHSTTAAEADAALPKADAALPKSLTVGGDAALQKMRDITMRGPYSAKEAAENGLITGISYRQYVLDSVLEAEHGGSEDNKLMGFYHYHRVMNRAMARSKEPIMDVGVVYLMGTIGESGDFDAGSVVRGLRQAGEDDDIGCVVLRIDSGGGGVVDSDSIDQAVRDLREKKGKVVIASFSNAAASGGYLAACHTDAIMAHASTLTGSIGVAALRPSFTPTFTDKLKVTVQSILTGSDYSDLTKELTGPNLAKYKMHVDEMYDDFKSRVVEGREMHPDMIQHLAGGRVYTGQMAFDMLEEVNKNRPAVEDLPGTVRLPHSGASQQKQDTPSTAASKAGEGVQLAEGQEMSPFSVVEEPVEAADAISTGSSEAVSLESGPLGRGIVDGLGGIRDAAALAAEVYLTRSLAALKLEKPGITDAEAIQEILPGMKFEVDDQKVVVPIDVDLKQFPVEKSFWQLYKEMANKGDAINDPGHAGGPSSMVNLIKVAVAGWVLSSAAKVLTEEMDSLGLADVRRAMGVGSRSRGRAYMRAEAPRWSGIR